MKSPSRPLALPVTLTIWCHVTMIVSRAQGDRKPVFTLGSRDRGAFDPLSACNSTIGDDGAIVLSHDFRSQYYTKTNGTCTVTIRAPPRHKVALIFDEKFEVEGYGLGVNDYRCVDSLKIYDGNNVTDIRHMLTPVTGICGNLKPASLRSTAEVLTIKWETKGVGNFQGFSIYVVFFHERQCFPAKREFLCKNNRCLKLRHRCDAIFSCGEPDYSDEDESTCLKLTGNRAWDTNDNRRFADFLLSPFGIILGWSLFFLLLVALIFAGCVSFCYIFLCGWTKKDKEEFSYYSIEQVTTADDKGQLNSSLHSSKSQLVPMDGEIKPDITPWQADDRGVSDGKKLVKIFPTRRATEPGPTGGLRPSYKVSLNIPRRFTSPDVPTHGSSPKPLTAVSHSRQVKISPAEAHLPIQVPSQNKVTVLDNDFAPLPSAPNKSTTPTGPPNKAEEPRGPPNNMTTTSAGNNSNSDGNLKGQTLPKNSSPNPPPSDLKEKITQLEPIPRDGIVKGVTKKVSDIKDPSIDIPKPVNPPPSVVPVAVAAKEEGSSKELKSLKDILYGPGEKGGTKKVPPSPKGGGSRKFSLPLMGSPKDR